MKSYFDFFGGEVPLLKLLQLYGEQKDIHSVFGVILYTEEHPFVTKVLRDDDFWKALDRASGTRWPIFAIRPKPGMVTMTYPESEPGSIAWLVEIPEWREPAENSKLIEAFQIEDTSKLPLLLVFTELRSGSIGQLVWPFKPGDTAEECFKSVSSVVKTAQEAISRVTAPHIKSNDEVFNLIRNAHLQFHVLAGAEKAISVFKLLKDLFSH